MNEEEKRKNFNRLAVDIRRCLNEKKVMEEKNKPTENEQQNRRFFSLFSSNKEEESDYEPTEMPSISEQFPLAKALLDSLEGQERDLFKWMEEDVKFTEKYRHIQKDLA